MEFDETLPAGRHRVWSTSPGWPLHSDGRAELIVEHRGHHQDVEDIRLVGKVETNLEFRRAGLSDRSATMRNWRRPDIGRKAWIAGLRMWRFPRRATRSATIRAKVCCSEDALREQVLLATPVGAVPRRWQRFGAASGPNLNVEQCHREPHLNDPRWEALNEMKKAAKLSLRSPVNAAVLSCEVFMPNRKRAPFPGAARPSAGAHDHLTAQSLSAAARCHERQARRIVLAEMRLLQGPRSD